MCFPKKKGTLYFLLFTIAFVIQILEGWGIYRLGDVNCGTQMKLSCVLTNCFFLILVYMLIQKEQPFCENRQIVLIGDYSFGIYLSHVLFVDIINRVPFNIPFPITSTIVFILSFAFVFGLSKIVGPRVSRYLGLT